MRRHKIHTIVKILKKKFPLHHPVYVRLTKIKNDLGSAHFNGKYFLIKLNKDMDNTTMYNTLAHEWAHCMVDWDSGPEDGHSVVWGKEYSKIYRFLFVEMDDNVI